MNTLKVSTAWFSQSYKDVCLGSCLVNHVGNTNKVSDLRKVTCPALDPALHVSHLNSTASWLSAEHQLDTPQGSFGGKRGKKVGKQARQGGPRKPPRRKLSSFHRF